MKYKAIIFDLDGVICHTDRYHYQAWKQLSDRIGVCFDEEINNRLRGISRMDSLKIILEKWDGEPFSEKEMFVMAEEKNSIYKILLMQISPQDLKQEVKNTLDVLKSRGLKLGVGSSSKNTKLILKRIGLESYFDAISDGTNITHTKPHPEVFLKAAEYLSLDPKECLVVEDAKAGIMAAASAGMESAAIGDACGYEKATYSLLHFSDLICCVE